MIAREAIEPMLGETPVRRQATLEALRINGLAPNSTSYIVFYIEASASRELNLGRDMLICAGNFQFIYNLAGEEEGEV